MTPATFLLLVLGGLAGVYAIAWGRRIGPAARGPRSFGWSLALGAVTNFFDTLGVGSFAPTTAAFRFLGLVPDRVIPGTLNVGHALPSVAQALIFIAIVEVGPWTLATMIAAAVAGAWFGAGIVSSWQRRRVQIGMGLALLAAAGLMLRQLLVGAPGGADALSLAGIRLALGLAGNFALGALMMLGVGLYAPCMILVSLLGMNAKAAFPIMMGSCAFLMPVAGWRFITREAYAPRVALGLTLGGVPAVLIAAFVVRGLSVEAVRALVFCVAVYTACTMLWTARRTG